MNCLECGKEVKQTDGKRAKLYCDPTCRSRYFVKQKKAANPNPRKPGRPKTNKLEYQLAEAAELRNNPLINAARGRDANGVNEDEMALAEKESKAAGKKKLLEAIRKQPMINKECLVPRTEEQFMGHLIPKGLKGIELSIWKAEIKEKKQ